MLRDGGFPGTIVGPGDATAFGSVLGQLFKSDFPTWSVGVSEWPAGEELQAVLARADARLYGAKLAKPGRSAARRATSLGALAPTGS